MRPLRLEFNPDCMELRDVKIAAQLLRDLIQKREELKTRWSGTPEGAALTFLESFDTLTQNVEDV